MAAKAKLRELNDTRQLRLERQELRRELHPDDPYRNLPIVRSPYLLSDNTPSNAQEQATQVAAAASVATPDQPGHPRFALHQQCSAGVDALDRQLGRQPDQSSACMTASLTTLAAANGLDRVDHVSLSKDGSDTWNAWSAGGMRRETNIGSNSLTRVIVGSRSCCRQPVTTGPDTLMNSCKKQLKVS
ncbi:XVIPCD domain-containing protein [Xanthomonas hortorum]|uniref:X-Tfes XVIPCD domain-containing protein n=2 Tax=Xanthomonas hortorum TaxID=56454 RepID=A0A9X4H9Y3_9XANT|nr:XVIPCD domain-containing protein [Xanthomonas hortorum]MCE4372837.1 hypothetical protein [Xanthomonas hortorum pv. hederae]MDC8640617.1 hypothetical protein [Xanthomonas hortorum pv. hederae]